MQIKRYEARNIQEALGRIRKELGADAIILSSKEYEGPKGPQVEVVAAKDGDAATGRRPGVLRLAAGVKAPAAAVAPPEEKGPEWESLKEDIGELKALLRRLKKRDALFDDFGEVKERLNILFDLLGLKDKGGKHPLSQVYSRLVAQGVSRESACVLLELLGRGGMADRIGAPEEGMKMVEDLIRGRFKRKQGSGNRGRIKILLGPTGVGKTTTIAKLAAHYALGEKLRVGLATTDTFRIAAPEQLKTYARIMDLPMQVAADAAAMDRALEQFADRDIILVDTPGMGLNDRSHFERVKGLFGPREDTETSLLLSLASSRENLFDTLACFDDLRIDQLILTKVDECRRFGFLFDLMDKAGKPVPYVTTGQNVPKDICAVNSGDLARLIVGGTLH